jgi:hypothetical protein
MARTRLRLRTLRPALTETDATVYWRNNIPTDPNYVDTNMRLQFYRLQLKNRSLQFGPPPNANCPCALGCVSFLGCLSWKNARSQDTKASY